MNSDKIHIKSDWKNILENEFEKDYFKNLKIFLEQEILDKKIIYPPDSLIFNAFDKCSFKHTKVVILGQDPYHGPNQAHGLSFSVNKGVRVPPSLQNIYKELNKDLGCSIPNHGNLEAWAKQGVLLLNRTLTVQHKSPASHKEKGWEIFTNNVIKKISEKKEFVIFLLWGKFAQSSESLIDTSKHIILKSPHPSPFSAHKGFFGCQHFSKTNQLLKEPINWQIEN